MMELEEVKEGGLPSDSQHTYVVFGKTGAGKSTVINRLQNKKQFKTSNGIDSCTE